MVRGRNRTVQSQWMEGCIIRPHDFARRDGCNRRHSRSFCGVAMTEQSYPSDLQAILNELDRTDAEARNLVSKLTEAQLNWQPGGGTGWSVAQCLDHLTQSTVLYTPALQASVRKARVK